METNLLTIAELARNLALPESTARYYCNRFAAHLPSVGEGRRRRYKPEALETLRAIAQTMRRDKNAYAVDLALRDGEAPPRSSAATPLPVLREDASIGSSQLAGQMLAMMENQTRALEEIAEAVSLVAAALCRQAPEPVPAAVPAAPKDGEKDQDAALLREEVAALRERIRSSESVHQNDLEQLRKWLTRLGEAVTRK
jgi:DNA-binding transcriptional MerR regulator